MRRLRLRLADAEVEFTDREVALNRVEELGERGTRFVEVVYGPEGCGKTDLLRQSAQLLRDLGFEVVYIDPLSRAF
ncbi:ATP-binding protein [Vulcanisaeta thermophila]|uniref:ATP-binding protein n=1 Tax=Vulcanisaeta thermophila TaxID=867917 RepID=UPI000852CEAA|nr:ATP-binding protein [Vulcanisaeta thermophila]